jgi:hypothetical protein
MTSSVPPVSPNPASTPALPDAERKENHPDVDETILRPYPKVIYFYLTWIASLICGIVVSLSKEQSVNQTMTYIWIIVFTFNLLVISFEFGRMLSVAVVFFVLALVFLGAWLGFLGKMFSFLGAVEPHADHRFFFTVFVVFTLIYLLVLVQTRFNYWVVRRNELLQKHGFLGDVKRYNAQNIKINKEIPDILEFILLRCGTIVVHPETEDRAFVLENIIGINKKEREVKEILESYAVRIRKD